MKSNHSEDKVGDNINKGDGSRSGNRSLRNIVSLDNFKIVRNHNSVDQDKIYLQERKKDFSEKGFLAESLERIAANGFEDDLWLGNVPNKDHQTPFDVDPVYSACLPEDEAITYDDVVNRIDYAVMIQSKKDEKSVTIGFDITTNSNIDSIKDKLLRSSNNGQKELPFGFSSIDYPYYPNGQMLSEIAYVPRYCIAMDIDDKYVKDYDYAQQQSYLEPTNEKLIRIIENNKRSLKRKNDKARFLVLSEVYEQNELYLSMLPVKDGRNNRIIELAEERLKTVKAKIWTALQRASVECPIAISAAGSIDPTQQTEKDQTIIKSLDRRKAINEKIKQLVQERGTTGKRTQEEKDLQLERYELVKRCIMDEDKCYATLITEANELKKQSNAGTIDYLKQIQPRNKKL